MIDISTLFESLFQKLTSDYWEHLSYETIDQPLTTVIMLIAIAVFQSVRLIQRRLRNDQNNGLDHIREHLSENQVVQEVTQNTKQITSLQIDPIRNQGNQQSLKKLEGEESLERQQTTTTQLKQQKTECINTEKVIKQFQRKRNEAKIKQASDANRLILQQKMKQLTDQRNELVYEQMKRRKSILFKNKKPKIVLTIDPIENNKTIKQPQLIYDTVKINKAPLNYINQPIIFISQLSKTPAISSVLQNQKAQSNQTQNQHGSPNLVQPCPKKQIFQQNNIQIQTIKSKQPQKQSLHSLKQIICEYQFLQTIMNFACGVKSTVQITTSMSNLGGARSSLLNLFVFAKSFISTINTSNDKQVTAFGIKIYNSIVFTLIHNSNLREGVERIPPRSRSSQVEKNSINCYILIINVYRLMGFQKLWLIVFGKLLKLLEFTYKRRQCLKSHEDLELIVNGYIEKKGEISSRYLSRLDYLTYLLFGLTAFDPVLVWNLNRKDEQVVKGRDEMLSWKISWQYKEFWILVNAFLKNENQFYFRPVIFMNILAVLYPRIYMHKSNSDIFKHQMVLYQIVLNKSKDFFAKYKTNQEIQSLSNIVMAPYQYDGEDFKQCIKVLQNRILVQKASQIGLNACDFEAKGNVFYYFAKGK